MSQAQRSVLVIDDDPRLRQVVAMYLGIEGYQVFTASNGAQGLAEVEARRPHAVIVDVMMPGMDGVETCRRLRANPATQDVPVLMLTALGGDDAAEKARQAGATQFLTKPFNLVGLGQALKSLVP
jgi:DNA-binding response OmpR family regulator